jgi:hypothetical protein
MSKKDWIFSGIASIILIGMIASNIWLIILGLSLRIVEIVIYSIAIILIIYGITLYRFKSIGTHEFTQQHWVKNHLLFWIMTDLHFIVVITRYILPNVRQGGLLPELLILIHIVLIFIVIISDRYTFYRKHELGLNFLLHAIVYGFISYSFIQLVVQTMQ